MYLKFLCILEIQPDEIDKIEIQAHTYYGLKVIYP